MRRILRTMSSLLLAGVLVFSETDAGAFVYGEETEEELSLNASAPEGGEIESEPLTVMDEVGEKDETEEPADTETTEEPSEDEAVTNVYGKSANSTIGTATNVTDLTSILSGKLEYYSDNNYYRLTIPQDGSISFFFSHQQYSDGEWRVELLDTDQKEILYSYFNATSTINEYQDTVKTGIPKGTYYLRVYVFYSTCPDSAYNIKINYVATDLWEKEFNESNGAANDISCDTVVNGTMRTSADEDHYRFSLRKAGEVSISFAHAERNNESWEVYLMDANGNRVGDFFEKKFYGTTNPNTFETTDKVKLSAGTYYIRIRTPFFGEWIGSQYALRVNSPVPAAPTKVAMSKVTVKLDAKSYAWSENGVTPTFTVTYKKKTVPSSEYQITYQNDSNLRAGTATAILTGTGTDENDDSIYFTGTKKVKFKIAAHSMSAGDVAIDAIGAKTYTYGGVKPTPTVRYNGEELTAGTDYTVSYQNYKSVTTEKTKKLPTVVVKGKGNFKGTLKQTFTITQKELDGTFDVVVKDVKWSKKKNFWRQTPTVLDADGHKLKVGRDYVKLTRASYDYLGIDEGKNPEVGYAMEVTIQGKGNYTGTISGIYTVE